MGRSARLEFIKKMRQQDDKPEQSVSTSEEDTLNFLEHKANTHIDNKVIYYMPLDIITNEGSIFDGSDDWYEIMEIEVEEDGWESVEKFIRAGAKGYIDKILKRGGTTREKVKKGERGRVGCGIYSVVAREDEIEENFFKEQLCYDGIILMEGTPEIEPRIVARREMNNGKNLYKIYSNKRIQTISIWGEYCVNDCMGLSNCLACYRYDTGYMRDSHIGIGGLGEILSENNVAYSYNKNYLLYSLSGTGSDSEKFSEDEAEEISPGLYLIKEKGATGFKLELNIENTSKNKDRAKEKMIRFYEKQLLLQQKNIEIVNQNKFEDSSR